MQKNTHTNRCIALATLSALTICIIPFLLAYTENFAFAGVKSADELAYLSVITQKLYNFEWSTEYLKNFHTFGYGQVWWATMCFVLAPGYIMGDEWLMFITARATSLAFYMGSLWFTFLLVERLIDTYVKLFALVLLFVLVSLTQISIVKSSMIYADSMLIFFFTLSIFYLTKSDQFSQKYFFNSLICFIIAVSIKTTILATGIMYPVYLLLNRNTLSLTNKFYFKCSTLCILMLILCNPTFLFPEVFADYIKIIQHYSSVTRNGWPDLQHQRTLGSSLQNFSQFYLNPIFVLITLITPLLNRINFKRHDQFHNNSDAKISEQKEITWHIFVLLVSPLLSVICFALFYTWLPNHYAFPFLILFIPIGIIAIDNVEAFWNSQYAKTRKKHFAALPKILSCLTILITALLFNESQILSGIKILSNPVQNSARVNAINTIAKGLDELDFKPKYVGLDSELGMPKYKGERPEYWMLNELDRSLIISSDLLIFWEGSQKYKNNFIQINRAKPNDFPMFKKIKNGDLIAGIVRFKKIFDANEIVFFERQWINVIETESDNPFHGANNAFDGSTLPNDFWEHTSGDKTWVSIKFLQGPRNFKFYEFVTGETPDRMPKNWRVFGLNERDIWVLVDERDNETNWLHHETRRFDIAQNKKYHGIRFEFMKGNNPNVLRIYEITFQ